MFKQANESSHSSVNSDLCPVLTLFPHLKPICLHTSFVMFLLIAQDCLNHQLRKLPHTNQSVAKHLKHSLTMPLICPLSPLASYLNNLLRYKYTTLTVTLWMIIIIFEGSGGAILYNSWYLSLYLQNALHKSKLQNGIQMNI